MNLLFRFIVLTLLCSFVSGNKCATGCSRNRQWVLRKCDRNNAKITNKRISCVIKRCKKGWRCAESRKPKSPQSPSLSSTPSITPSVTPTPSPSLSASVTPSITPSPSPKVTGQRETYAEIRDFSCPPGQEVDPVRFNFECDFQKLHYNWLVEKNLVNPVNALCPNRPSAGGGSGGCRVCGDGVNNLRVPILETDGRFGGNCMSQVTILTAWGTELFAEAERDGVDICTLDFEVNDGGTYITQTLANKMNVILQNALCVDSGRRR